MGHFSTSAIEKLETASPSSSEYLWKTSDFTIKWQLITLLNKLVVLSIFFSFSDQTSPRAKPFSVSLLCASMVHILIHIFLCEINSTEATFASSPFDRYFFIFTYFLNPDRCGEINFRSGSTQLIFSPSWDYGIRQAEHRGFQTGIIKYHGRVLLFRSSASISKSN